jgi:uncharacterized Zn-binding protein involved in type VI secretion
MGTKIPICVGDAGSHSTLPSVTVMTSGQDGTVLCGSIPVCCLGATYTCNDTFHGTNIPVISNITPNTVKTFVNGKLVVVQGAVAGCGATMIATPRNVFVE